MQNDDITNQIEQAVSAYSDRDAYNAALRILCELGLARGLSEAVVVGQVAEAYRWLANKQASQAEGSWFYEPTPTSSDTTCEP
jgi:hypothetical protein